MNIDTVERNVVSVGRDCRSYAVAGSTEYFNVFDLCAVPTDAEHPLHSVGVDGRFRTSTVGPNPHVSNDIEITLRRTVQARKREAVGHPREQVDVDVPQLACRVSLHDGRAQRAKQSALRGYRIAHPVARYVVLRIDGRGDVEILDEATCGGMRRCEAERD